MFQIYFYPFINAENDIDGFQAQLINDSDSDFLYDITFVSKRHTPQRFTAQVLSFDSKKLNYIKFDHLNEGPSYEATFWLKSKTGTGSGLKYTLKVKPKSFFKHKRVDSYTQETYYALTLDQVVGKDKPPSGESLKSYTHANNIKEEAQISGLQSLTLDIMDKANFEVSLDLHIEMLTGDPGAMNTFEKLQYQIFKAKEYLEEAHMLGIDKVYLLHGVGKGRLKDELAILLKSDNTVSHFKNEYHGSYGYGATEVTFK